MSNTREQTLYELDFTNRPITNADKEICASHLHFCPEWDFMPVDSDCPEYEFCICYE